MSAFLIRRSVQRTVVRSSLVACIDVLVFVLPWSAVLPDLIMDYPYTINFSMPLDLLFCGLPRFFLFGLVSRPMGF